jgi:transposase InsO family protein
MNHEEEYPVSRMCHVLGVSRSGYYKWLKAERSKRFVENQELLEQIKCIHKGSHQLYGSPKILFELRKNGYRCGHNRVARIMRKNGIKSKVGKKFRPGTTIIKIGEAPSNILDRRFTWDKPDQAWATDITYIRTKTDWVYLCVFLDLCSRMIVGWSVSKKIDTELVLMALNNACANRKPGKDLIIHSDQGSQFGSDNFRQYLKNHKFVQSMSRRGNCWDNACVESFFRLLKVEDLYDYSFKNIDEVRYRVFAYIEYFYNRRRIHSSLGYMSPASYEQFLIA